MWAHPFNHPAAVAAAKERAAELRARARMLGLAKLTAVANRGEITKKQQLLKIRQRGLEQFIDDPYPPNSLLHIGFERDRRAILEAGMSLCQVDEGSHAPLPAIPTNCEFENPLFRRGMAAFG